MTHLVLAYTDGFTQIITTIYGDESIKFNFHLYLEAAVSLGVPQV